MKNNNRFDGLLGEVASELLWMGMGVLFLWILFSWWWLIQDVRYQWSLDRLRVPGSEVQGLKVQGSEVQGSGLEILTLNGEPLNGEPFVKEVS